MSSKFLSSAKLIAILVGFVVLLVGGITFVVYVEDHPRTKMCVTTPC